MHRSRAIIYVTALMAVLLAATVFADIPRKISYQGRATDASGNPVPDDDYQVRFYIYDHPTAGTALWLESFFTIHTSDGYFTHLLGSLNPIPDSLFANYDSLYLAVMFNNEWLSPRTAIATAGYAFRVNSVDGASGGTIDGQITLNGTASDIVLNPNGTDNSSVQLPDNAIYRAEIRDEPGIAVSSQSDVEFFSSTSATDVLTVSIVTPSDGYIVVEAKFSADGRGSGLSRGWVQIDETSGGTAISPYYSYFGADSTQYSYGLAGRALTPGYVSRVYYKTAGSYTFRLEGGAASGNCGGCNPGVMNVILMATYFPTAYGSVEAFVSETEAGQYEEATPVQVDGTIMYQVDLRELELRAAKAEAEAERARANAEKAQRELLRAKYESSGDPGK